MRNSTNNVKMHSGMQFLYDYTILIYNLYVILQRKTGFQSYNRVLVTKKAMKPFF